jgi:hypothetical protein
MDERMVKSQLAQINEARSVLTKHAGIMTEFERRAYAAKLHDMREASRPMLETWALSQWAEGRANVKAALQGVLKAKAAESKRWDPQKLSAHMNVYQTRLDQAIAAARGDNGDLLARLKALYDEAEDSGDNFERRAAAEAMKTAVARIKVDITDAGSLGINNLVQQAERDLVEIRNSAEVQKAEAEAAHAVADMNKRKHEMFGVAETLGDLSPNGGLLHNMQFEQAITAWDEESNPRSIGEPS